VSKAALRDSELELVRPERGVPIYIVAAAGAVVALYLAIGRLPPLAIALGFGAYLGVLGWILLVRHRRESRASRRWRDAMPCYVSVQDKDLRIIDSNERFRRDFGDRHGELCHEVYKGRDTPCPQCTVREVLKDGRIRTHKSTVIRKNGEVAHIISTTAPQRNSRGEIVAAVEMFTDITELESVRTELEKTRRDYHRFFDNLPSHASVLDRDLRLLATNALYRRDFGEHRPGARCYEVCKGRNAPCVECLVEKTFETKEVHASEELLTTRDGRQLNMVVYSMPILDGAGETTAVMEVFTDISEVKRLESELALMGRAVAGIAHRIKNILMGLEGGIFVINTGMEDGDQAQIAQGWEMIESNVARVSRIVKDLLYCSKERRPPRKDRLALCDLAREVCDLYRERAEADEISLRLEVSGEPNVGFYDRDGLHSMLCNRERDRRLPVRPRREQARPRHHRAVPARAVRGHAPRGGGHRLRHPGGVQHEGLPGLLLHEGYRGDGHRAPRRQEGRRGARRRRHVRDGGREGHDLPGGDTRGGGRLTLRCGPSRVRLDSRSARA
jgi:PAS domain-containing protein